MNLSAGLLSQGGADMSVGDVRWNKLGEMQFTNGPLEVIHTLVGVCAQGYGCMYCMRGNECVCVCVSR